MAKQCRLHLISKLRTDACIFHRAPYAGKGRPRNTASVSTHEIDAKYCLSTDTISENRSVQMEARHKNRRRTEILKTNLASNVLLFSLILDAEKMIEYYSLRFQISSTSVMNCKMNVNKIPVNNAVNLSMFMVSVSAKLTFRCNTEFSVFLKHATGGEYLHALKNFRKNLN